MASIMPSLNLRDKQESPTDAYERYLWIAPDFLHLFMIEQFNPYSYSSRNLKGQYIYMVMGRFIFGLFESIGFVPESYYINKWFKGKDNSLVFGYFNKLIIDLREYFTDTQFGQCRQIKQFGLEFYTTLISCATCYAKYLGIRGFSVKFLDINLIKTQPIYFLAFLIISLPFQVPSVAIMQTEKKKTLKFCYLQLFQLLSNTIFQLMPECDTQGITLLLIGSLLNGFFLGTYFAVMWLHIPQIIPSHMVGIGFGLTYSWIDIELTSFLLIIANKLGIENFENYKQMNFFLLQLSVWDLFLQFIYSNIIKLNTIKGSRSK